MTIWNTVKHIFSSINENNHSVLVCLIVQYTSQCFVDRQVTSVNVIVSLAFVNVIDRIIAIIVKLFFLLLEISVGNRKGITFALVNALLRVTVCILEHSMYHLAGIQDFRLHIASQV